MKTKDLVELSRMEEFSVSSLFLVRQNWRQGHTFVMDAPRRQNAFLWFCGCEGSYALLDGTELHAPRGALVSVPQGSEYRLRFDGEISSPATVLLEFCLYDGEDIRVSDTVEILEPHLDDRRIIDVLMKMCAEYVMPSRPWHELKAGFYTLLSLLASRQEHRLFRRRGLQTIERGIRYLQVDEKQELSLDEVAAMCYVTPAYFRRLFREYAGMSPAQYRIRRKTERAKELLSHADMSVAEISDVLGYDNPSYFCRAFKKETKQSPSEYRRELCIEK